MRTSVTRREIRELVLIVFQKKLTFESDMYGKTVLKFSSLPINFYFHSERYNILIHIRRHIHIFDEKKN